jgi:hypothetical protein
MYYGTYAFTDKNIELRDDIGELIFIFEIVDSMNIKLLYAKNNLFVGEYLNRHSSYFEGHRCSSSKSFNDFFARWSVFILNKNDTNTYYEIIKFKNPGFIFKNEDYIVEQFQDSLFKR